jgi:uncharacterized protein (TIGR02099 family)
LNIAFFWNLRKVALSTLHRWIGLPTLAIYRLLTWATLILGFTIVAAALAVRYWVLPNIENYREGIAAAISKAATQRVTIGKISGSWAGIHPELILEDITVFDPAGRPALRLGRIDNSLSWRSLLALEPRFRSLEIHHPALRIVRDRRGVVSVAGVELKEGEGGIGFSDWLLRQQEIVVRDASITWHDELRGAPPLALRNVGLTLRNDGDQHRFGLRAVPPAELAGPLDLRGDLRGKSLETLARWSGRLYAKLDGADLAAWRSWVPFPIDVPQGSGALRIWATVDSERLRDLIADVRLANVRTRLAAELPELDLTELAGRIAWKSSVRGFEVSTVKLGLVTQKGLTLPPADFLLRLESDPAGKPARGELRANAIELEPLAVLADRLPLGVEVRRQLLAAAPRGSLFDVVARWSGEWRAPAQFSIRGRFEELALARTGSIPGFSGLSGNIDGTEKTGTLHFSNVKSTLDMPKVFAAPLAFDTLTGQLIWSRDARATELRLNNVAFANSDVTGTLFGAWRGGDSGPGTADFSGQLTRVDASRVARYVPLTVARDTRTWIEGAFIAGQSNDVRFQVKGDLARFPFPDNKGGTFFVIAKVTGGTLHYGDGWPRIENIEGDLAFRGRRMDISARNGSIHGVRLPKVRAEIADLEGAEQVLEVSGEAEGATADFLDFIAKSPVAAMIDRFTDGMQAQGRGRLALKLTLPLQRMERSRVSGTFQIGANRLVADPDLPPLEDLSGRLEFTESEVRVAGATGTFLGGPISISAATQRDASVRVALQGRVNADNVRRAGGPAWMRYLRGATDWRGNLTLRRKLADLVVESNLQGVASALPAPFMKSAGESVPLRIERQFVGPLQERVALQYGNTASGIFLRRNDGQKASIERGTIRFGDGTATEPERAGLSITGVLRSLDVESWLRLLGEFGTGPSPAIGRVELKADEVNVYGRRFHDLAIGALEQPNGLNVTLAGRELDGSANWQPEGKGKVTARFSRLTVPDAPPGPVVPEPEKPALPDRMSDLPALSVTAQQFQLGAKPLGSLELNATNEGRDWRIERLHIASPDGNLTVDGVWQNWLSRPQTRVNIRFDVRDVGRMLARFGYPEGVRRGTAKIEGNLAWGGSPNRIDYPTLAGNFVLDSTKGQFTKLEPGIGKLLGILSLQSLPRRITLDFRDIFSEGFAYDQIVGAVKVNRGVATTDNLRIEGPSARVQMSGEVDLGRETQKLTVKVIPGISDSVSLVGGLLGGPVAGVGVFLAQKILKDPFDQIVSYEYAVTGTWNEPAVTKVQRSFPSEQNRSD